MIRKAARYPCCSFFLWIFEVFSSTIIESVWLFFFPRQFFELVLSKCSTEFEIHSAGAVQVGPHKRSVIILKVKS